MTHTFEVDLNGLIFVLTISQSPADRCFTATISDEAFQVLPSSCVVTDLTELTKLLEEFSGMSVSADVARVCEANWNSLIGRCKTKHNDQLNLATAAQVKAKTTERIAGLRQHTNIEPAPSQTNFQSLEIEMLSTEKRTGKRNPAIGSAEKRL